MKHNFIENNIIILSKQTIDLFLKQKNPADLIALYCFYYYTAKWQGTNQPKATTDYAAKGLKWGVDKIRKNKKILVALGLVEDVQHKDEKGRVQGWYIKINYIWKKENHPIDFPEGGLSHRVGKSDPNALSVDSKNALSVGNKIPINELIECFKPINPSYEKLFSNKTQRAALTRLTKKFGAEKLSKIIKLLPQTNAQRYAPTITTPLELEDRMGRLQSFFQRQQDNFPQLIHL